MTSAELVERALRSITPAPVGTASSLRTTLLTKVGDALRLLPIRVRERFGSREAESYRKNFTVALTSGTGSLATHTDLTSEPMVASDIVKVTHADAVSDFNPEGRLQFAGSRSALAQGRSDEFPSFAVEDNTIYTVMDGDVTALAGNATVRAGFVPLITNVKFLHEPLLVECLVELAQGQPSKKEVVTTVNA